MSNYNYSFEIFEFNEALTPYGTIDTKPPEINFLKTDDFTDGEHFRTIADTDTHALQLHLEDRLITMILDESGSMTWNDVLGDRYVYLKRLLNKLNSTYPGDIKANLISFGGTLTKTNLFIAQAGTDFLTADGKDFNQFLKEKFQDSVYDFAGVRVVRRGDRYPAHPADGVVVAEGILESIKDSDLVEGKRYYYGVWTFNKNLHFSNGKYISAVPHDRDLPQGVNFATATPRILPGIERDEYTILIYNFAEKSGFIVFDSSGDGNHGTVGSEVIEDNFWLGDGASESYNENDGKLKQNTGIRLDGEFDIIETEIDNQFSVVGDNYSNSQFITVNVWVFRYDRNIADNLDTWIIGTSKDVSTNKIGWAIGLKNNGNLSYRLNDMDGEMVDTGVFVPVKKWTMITVRFGNLSNHAISIYKNGVMEYESELSRNINTIGMNRLYIGAKPTDSESPWTGLDFFGVLNQISVSNISRNDSYIINLYENELLIFDQTIQDFAQTPPDNKQREVLLSWEIGKDFNYAGGTVKIVRKYRHTPGHQDDGDIVVEKSAEQGQYFYLDSHDFINNSNYYYRFFTINAIGNPCDRLDARIIPVHIPSSVNDVANPPLSTVSGEEVINGNRKVLIQWNNPTDARWLGTKIFYSSKTFPEISIASQGELIVSDGQEIADTTDTFFVHRSTGTNNLGIKEPLTNAQYHYYTIITYDRLGRISEPRLVVGIPSSQLSNVLNSDEVNDLHVNLINPKTLSIQWENPTIRTETLDLFFGETALVFVSVRDFFGGTLDDITNLKLKVCTKITERGLVTTEQSIGGNFSGDGGSVCEGASHHDIMNGSCEKGNRFDENCNGLREEQETVLTYATVESGLIKGLLAHTSDRFILSKRQRYEMAVRAQYQVKDQETSETLFQFNTEVIQVNFEHPIKMSLVNKLNKKVTVQCRTDGEIRGDPACPAGENCLLGDDESTSCQPRSFNGGYTKAALPYICRAEFQFKGESLSDGTPVNVQLFKHSVDFPLSQKTDRTIIREGTYQTRAVLEEALDIDGNPTGILVSKSIVDIEIPHPVLPDYVDLYVSVDYLGFFVESIQSIRFISNLSIHIDVTRPFPDGIDVAEQFATVWSIDPDFPDDEDRKIPASDGTLVKWELIKLRFGKDRPFYSIEPISELISGVYSSTVSGIARNVFFGPVGNVQSHTIPICQSTEECCIGEEYAIQASVIVDEDTSIDAHYLVFECSEDKDFINRKFLVNAANNQPGSDPHWITWADGESLLKFQIAKNPATSEMRGAECFRNCLLSHNGQMFTFPDNHIVQISADAEILWNVIFEEDPYTAKSKLISFDIAKPIEDENMSMPALANIPIKPETEETDFYVRLNRFVGSKNNPKPSDCESSGGGDGMGGGGLSSSCEWVNLCQGISVCNPTKGTKWQNVSTVVGQSTIIVDNKPVTLVGGGGYENGMPPVFIGFKEPLDVRIIEARVNGERISELLVDGVSQHTFVVEVTFAGCPVPDGTPIEIQVDGPDANIIILSNCINKNSDCKSGSSGIIYTRLMNDRLINPEEDMGTPGDCGTYNKKSLAYFSIDPLPDIAFNARINITCRYDKIGTSNREITQCIELNNTINILQPNTPSIPGEDPIVTTVSSNETIIYDTVNDIYQSTRSGLVMRMSHFAAAVAQGTIDALYVFGGFTEHDVNSRSGITSTGEIFNIVSQRWSFTSDMPTPRMGGMTIVHNEKIYCIGGLELDLLTQQYIVSRKIESFDTITESWTSSLSPMPEDNGVAFGDAQVVNDFIYVICGVTSVINNSSPLNINSKILRYSINDDDWDIISPNDAFLYSRISPFGFFRRPQNPSTSTTSIVMQSSSDDGTFDTESNEWVTESDFIYISSTKKTYIRFPINIPKGKFITDSYLSATVETETSGSVSTVISLLDTSDARLNWTSTTSPQSISRTKTQISWTIQNSTTEPSVSPVLSNLIQEFIGRDDYVPGNYIGIEIFDDGTSAGSKKIHALSSSGNNTKAMTLTVSYTNDTGYYVIGGSIPKLREQIEAEYSETVNNLLDKFRSVILTSPYYQSLTETEQKAFIEREEIKIRNSVVIPPYIYPGTGFIFHPRSEYIQNDELFIDISDTLDDDWTVLPKSRDHGQSVYIPHQDVVYFLGGSNQNQSTTLNRVESIDFINQNSYSIMSPLGRGRSRFAAVASDDDIYIIGGLTSGHKEGYIEIEVKQYPNFIQATGTESSGIIVNLRNDSGEIIDNGVRCLVRGRLRIPELDSVLINFLANRGADRALGGDGSGNATDLPSEGDQIDIDKLLRAQNKIIDPNSDAFQFNAARKLSEDVLLFPVLYTEHEFVVENGIAGVTMLPRSEDPLSDFQKLSEFIKDRIKNTPDNPNERFEGNLTREELIALGDALSSIKLPPIIIDAGTFRQLYHIETSVTIIDDFYFGQTISDLDIQIQNSIKSRIEELLTPPVDDEEEEDQTGDGENSGATGDAGSAVKETECFLLQHLAEPEIPPPDTPPPDDDESDEPGGTGGFGQSGQCLFCDSLIPLSPSTRPQLPNKLATLWNDIDWVPQIRKRLTDGHSLSDVIEELETIDHETPFGGSQLYNAIIESARISAGENFNDVKKVFYIVSDNSQNLSLSSRNNAISEVNSIDGDKNVPVVYTVFSTSFPSSISSMFERTSSGDVEKITKGTGGQSSTLTSSRFINQILNLTLGSATGGLGYGIYFTKIDFNSVSAITAMQPNFDLPVNTQGFIRFRHSKDSFNFSDFSERFEGNQTITFVNLFARIIEIEVVLTTGFTTEITEEYDNSATGIPKLFSITWETSSEREDFIFLNTTQVLTNVQQAAVAFDGDIPESSIVEIGVATSNSYDWQDFHSLSVPPVNEFGKSFILNRSENSLSIVPSEPISTVDGLLYVSNYGSWNPSANVSIFKINSDGTEAPVLSGFVLHPRNGEIYFNERQPLDTMFVIKIINDDLVRIGVKLKNRLHEESIKIHGVGYIYSTNNIKPSELSQVPPRAINVIISPQSPNASDTIMSLYRFIDLNNDNETGSIISWFKNGKQLFEIQNKTSFTNNDLNFDNRLQPNDKLYFSVTPSDGRGFGPTVFSTSVTIVARPPGSENVKIISIRNNVNNDRYDTDSVLRITYDFVIDDSGDNASEDGTIIKWFVNGSLFKESVFSSNEEDPYNNPKELTPLESFRGQFAHVIGNQIYAEITPKTNLVTGNTVKSNTINIVNSLAIVSNVQITPLQPKTTSTLSVKYELDDPDILNGNQTDQSEIHWLNSVNGVDFVPVPTLDNNQTVSSSFLQAGQHWRCDITGFDGIDLSNTVKSNVIFISPG